MGIKSILCIFEGSKDELSAVDTSLTLAETFCSRVRFLHLSQEYSSYTNLYDENILISLDTTTALEKENNKRLQKAKQYVASFSAHHHIALDSRTPFLHHAYAQFIHHTGNLENIIEKEGHSSDLIVLARSIEPEGFYKQVITTAILNTGRPVLLIPSAQYTIETWQDKTISIAWDNSTEAAKAIFNALPLLERAETLYLITARDHLTKNIFHTNKPIMEYLFAHGINSNSIMIEPNNHSSSKIILEKAKELKSDLLVMGAYSHSKFQEMLLGGFTRDMIEESNIPLLLSH